MHPLVPLSVQDVLNGTTVGQSASWGLTTSDGAPEANATQSRPDGPELQGALEGNVSAETPRLQMNLTLVNAPFNDSTSKEVGQGTIKRAGSLVLGRGFARPSTEHHHNIRTSQCAA